MKKTLAPDNLPANVIAALQNGNKIKAIKLLREATGMSLKEAKEAVESFHDEPRHAFARVKPPRRKFRHIDWLLMGVAASVFVYYCLQAFG